MSPSPDTNELLIDFGYNRLTFKQQDISVAALWNNDAAPGTPVITQYVWNDTAQQYLYAG